MASSHPDASLPLLRALDLRWMTQDGRDHLMLRDPLSLGGQTLLVPAPLAPLLGLMDGTRNATALGQDFRQHTGYDLPVEQVQKVVEQLGASLLLDDAAFRAARDQALHAYRSGPSRTPALAGTVYPDDPQALGRYLADFGVPEQAATEQAGDIVGVISPHIDYERGGRTYAQVWHRAAAAVRAAELIVIFGTDHAGAPGLTLTRQHYATPWGVLPTDLDVVDALAHAIGPEQAFAQELHHRHEHSIELATVWLHYLRDGQPCPVVPVLCGSFAPFVSGEQELEADAALAAAFEVLLPILRQRRTLVVAAADLAHLGPAFGDPDPVDLEGRQLLGNADGGLLEAAANGDAASFFHQIREAEDSFRICGLPPIYLTLRLLGETEGDIVGYDQCPADAENASLVSIAGIVLRRLS